MKSNIINILTIILFVSIITVVPLSLYIVGNSNNNSELTENRNLAEFPEISIKNFVNFPSEFEEYYNDHLPLRDTLISTWKSLNYNLFNTIDTNSVIKGKDNWLFYRNDNSLSFVQGIEYISVDEKRNLLNKLQYEINKLKEQGTETYILIIPNKENIYKEYLPDTVHIRFAKNKTEDLIDYLNLIPDINIIYPKHELLEAKENYQVYYKYDTHWNSIGALVSTIALEKKINPNFNYDLNNIKIKTLDSPNGMDLSNMAGLSNLYEKTISVENFESQINNIDSEKKILFIGDSFLNASAPMNMKKYFSTLHTNVTYSEYTLNMYELINEIKPDILILETIERYYEKLLNLQFYN